MVMSQNVMLHLYEGDFIMFDEIPISTIEVPEGDLKRSLTYPCPRSLHESRPALRIKHFFEEQTLAYPVSCEINTP